MCIRDSPVYIFDEEIHRTKIDESLGLGTCINLVHYNPRTLCVQHVVISSLTPKRLPDKSKNRKRPSDNEFFGAGNAVGEAYPHNARAEQVRFSWTSQTLACSKREAP